MAITAKQATDPVVTDQSPDLTASVVFDLLSNTRRRYVLYHLRAESEASIRELSRRIAAWENDVDVSAVSSKQRKRVYTALHQTHLPRLDDYGVVEYDRDRGRIQPTDRMQVFEPYLEQTDDESRNWPRYYLGIGLATMVLAVGMISGLPLVAAVEPGIAALIVGTAVVSVAAVHAGADARGHVRPTFPDLQPSHWTEEVPADD